MFSKSLLVLACSVAMTSVTANELPINTDLNHNSIVTSPPNKADKTNKAETSTLIPQTSCLFDLLFMILFLKLIQL